MANRRISVLDSVTAPDSTDVLPIVNGDNTRKIDLRQLQNFMAMSCRLATTANIDLNVGGLLDIDGISTATGNRILVWQQSNAAENGIYTVADGSWTRAVNFSAAQNMIRGVLIPILEGSMYAGSIFQHTTTQDITLNTTTLAFTQVSPPSWGAIRGDITTQTDLVNRINDDITTAVANLREGVPTEGDTLNKLYDLIQGIVGVSASATDIADRDAQMAALEDQQNVYVADASADPTVNSGWAIYKYVEITTSFIKITEQESLDVNFNWGALQGDITAQPDLINRIDSDITTAVDNLREGVPTEGDTLNKLYAMNQQIARQEVSPVVSAPSALEDGFIISWDEANNRYDLVPNEGTAIGRYAAVYYVDPVSGNDATAARNSTESAYLTINAAADAAYDTAQSTGISTLVYIKFGTYEEHSITRNGVDIYAEDGVLVYTAQETVSILSDQSDSYFGSGNRFNVYGKGAYFNLNAKPFNDSVAVNIRRQTNCYIEANALGDVQVWLDPAETHVHVANATVHFSSNAGGGSNKHIIYTNCTLYTPVKIDAWGDADVNFTYLYDRCTFILLPDYSYMADTRLWRIDDRFNATTIDIIDPAVSGSNTMDHYQTGFTSNEELLANYVPHNFRLSYTCIVEGYLEGQSRSCKFVNCEFVITREFCNGIMVLQNVATASENLIFNNVIIRDETPSGDTTAFIAGQLPTVTDPLHLVLNGISANAGTDRKSFPEYEDMPIAYYQIHNIPSWGELQGDINTQTDLTNRINTDITTAVAGLREGVPSEGDTLNKLYNLQEALSTALGDKADRISNVYDMTVMVGPEEEETSPANASITVRTWLDNNPGSTGRIVILPGVYEENEINRHEVDIWAVDGAIVWSAQPARSILSDRHIGANVILRVYGKGVFVHAAPNGANDQQAINFRYAGADVYVQAKTIDMPQMWHNGFQQLTVEDCDFIFRDPGSNRSNVIIELNNCRFPNGMRVSGYNNGFSTLKIRNSEIIIPRKTGFQGIAIRDNEGNIALTVDHTWMISEHDQNNTQQLLGLSGGSGEGNITIEGIDYPIGFTADAETTIENFISTHSTALQDTIDRIRLYRATVGTLSGTEGEGTFTVDGFTYIISFDADSATSAQQFVAIEGPGLGAIGVTCKAIHDQLVFTRTDGIRPVVSFANTSGDLNVSMNSDYLLTESDEKVEFAVTFSNTSGDLSVQVTDYYSLQDLADQVFSRNSWRHGYAGIHKNHYFAAGGNEGRGQNVWLENVLIRLQKRKTIGIKMVPRQNELTGRYGGLYVRGLYIRDETGTGETIAVVQGYDSNALTQPFAASINGLLHNCGQNMARISSLDDMPIESNDPAYRTVSAIGQEVRPDVFDVPFTKNLTQIEIILLNGAPESLTETIIGVVEVTYRTAPNNDDWTVMADFNEVVAYAETLTENDTYFLEITVSDVVAQTGFVRIVQS